jgi:hypothetical protein
MSQFDLPAFGFREQHVGGQVIAMIEKDVSFDAAFDPGGTWSMGTGSGTAR